MPHEEVGSAIAETMKAWSDFRTPEQWDAHEAKVEAERVAREAEAEERRQVEIRRTLVERGCPAKDLERAISGELQDTAAMAEARGALKLGLVLLVLSGGRGVGKTTAAAWWVAQRHEPAKYVRTGEPRFVDATALARWPKYEDDKMRELERASALVIDDLGVEYDDRGGAFRSFLDGLVNARYAAELPTLITTNLPVADRKDGAAGFRTRYGERIADRIRESGRFVEIDGESMRRRP